MVLYNVTVNVSPDIETDWLLWMKKTHIPEVLSTKRFYDHRFLKMLSEHPDAEGNTYAIQYMARNMGELDAYLADDAPILRQKQFDMFGEKCLAFRTVLEEV